MDKTELYVALTLWFAAMIFLQTSTGQSVFVEVGGAVAVIFTFVMPIVIVVDLAFEILGGEND